MNIVKIKQEIAYCVEIEKSAEEFMIYNYGHIFYKVGEVWLNIGSDKDIADKDIADKDIVVIYNTNTIKKLNKAFKETNGLIHEQLDLF